jgi:hypothetical protein
MITFIRQCQEPPGDIDDLIFGDGDTVPSERAVTL